MKENHFAYKLTHETDDINANHPIIESSSMLSLLKKVKEDSQECIYWVFKQFDDAPRQQLCIIDKIHDKIYYNHSSDVEDLQATIERLSK